MERKVKYSYEFKLKCVELVVKKHLSCLLVSNQKGVCTSEVKKWVRFYNEYGKNSLLPKVNQSYSIDFKLQVLKEISENNLSLHLAHVKYNIPSRATVVKWQKDFITFGIEGLKTKPRGRPKSMNNFKRKKRKSDKPLTREEELLLENEALRAENALLKKLQALIQAEENKKQKP